MSKKTVSLSELIDYFNEDYEKQCELLDQILQPKEGTMSGASDYELEIRAKVDSIPELESWFDEYTTRDLTNKVIDRLGINNKYDESAVRDYILDLNNQLDRSPHYG